MKYVKYRMGGVTQLISVTNEVAQAEAEESGFKPVIKNGVPELVDSSTLLDGNSGNSTDAILQRIAERSARH